MMKHSFASTMSRKKNVMIQVGNNVDRYSKR